MRALMGLAWDGPLSFLMQRDNPHGDPRLNILHQYQRGREIFLRIRYDAMLVIESDIVPPADTLQRLAALRADVAYGCYLFRGNRQPIVNVYEDYSPPAVIPRGHRRRPRNRGESLTLYGLWEEAKRAGVIDCSGAGLGCVLIRRPVLEAHPFRTADRRGCDVHWTDDVYHSKRWTMKADTGVICGHKTPEGEMLWPT